MKPEVIADRRFRMYEENFAQNVEVFSPDSSRCQMAAKTVARSTGETNA
jgi:hypothetical protein